MKNDPENLANARLVALENENMQLEIENKKLHEILMEMLDKTISD